MKKIAFIAAFAGLIFTAVSCGDIKSSITSDDVNNPATASGDYDPENAPIMEFEATEFNFGTIKDGEKVHHIFKFKNTGKGNLIIAGAVAACGCTKPEYPDEPIPPGESGEIDVVFNSSGRHQTTEVVKTVTVTANTMPNSIVLKLRGMVTK